MAKGDVLPSESVSFRDPDTGIEVRQVTRHASIHHHPFFYIPAYDDAMRRLYFVSHRTGKPQIFAERRTSGDLIQLTDREDLNEWSLHPSHDGRFVYFTTPDAGWRLEVETLQEERLIDLTGTRKAGGMVGAGMGTTTLSRDDRWWAIPLRRNGVAQLLAVETATGDWNVACENEAIGHPEFHPEDSTLLRYGGPYDRRVWIARRDGSAHHLAYQRDASRKEWIVHECWRPGTREILTANWPHGVISIDVDTGKSRWVTRSRMWHPMVDRKGHRMVSDTKLPDVGLQVFEIGDAPADPVPLCRSEATSEGAHWDTDHCPYDDGPVEVYAPQHTHPHPNFSPCGKYVVFTSDRSGTAQVHEARLPGEAR